MTYIQAKNELQRRGVWFHKDCDQNERQMLARYIRSVRRLRPATYQAIINDWDSSIELFHFKHGFVQGFIWGRLFEATKNGR